MQVHLAPLISFRVVFGNFAGFCEPQLIISSLIIAKITVHSENFEFRCLVFFAIIEKFCYDSEILL